MIAVLADLATWPHHAITTANLPDHPLAMLTRPIPMQQKAFALLGISYRC